MPFYLSCPFRKKNKEKYGIYFNLPTDTALYNGDGIPTCRPFPGGRATAIAGVVQAQWSIIWVLRVEILEDYRCLAKGWKNISDASLIFASVWAITVSESDPKCYLCVGWRSSRSWAWITSHGDLEYISPPMGAKLGRIFGPGKNPADLKKSYGHPTNPGCTDRSGKGKPLWSHERSRHLSLRRLEGLIGPKFIMWMKTRVFSDLSMDMNYPRIGLRRLLGSSTFPWQVQSGGPGFGIYKSVGYWEDLGRSCLRTSKRGPMGKIEISVS